LASLQDRTKIILQQPDVSREVVVGARQLQRRLTPTETVEIARQYQAGAAMKDLALKYGVRRQTVSQCLRRLGIPLRKRGLQGSDIAEVARLYEDGWSLARLADKFGYNGSDVRNKLIAEGVKMRPRRGWRY
jgi:lambda repressor-like predicted transcriptional regulator